MRWLPGHGDGAFVTFLIAWDLHAWVLAVGRLTLNSQVTLGIQPCAGACTGSQQAYGHIVLGGFPGDQQGPHMTNNMAGQAWV